jgi:signal transduction histidine kinase
LVGQTAKTGRQGANAESGLSKRTHEPRIIGLAFRIFLFRDFTMSSGRLPLAPLGREELGIILDSLPEIVASFDGDGRLVYLNAAGRRRLDLQVAAPGVKVPLLSDILSEEGAEQFLREALPAAARTGSWRGRGELRSRAGEPIPVLLTLLSHGGGPGGRVAFTLVADPLESSAENHVSVIAIALGFIHDLKNLLTPVIAYASLARDRIDPESSAHGYLDQILRAAERAHSLSERLLQRLRLGTGDFHRLVLAEVVKEVALSLQGEHPEHRIETESPFSSTRITGDASALARMVRSLGKNAIEALPAAGGRVSISLRKVPLERELELTIRDDGHGMDEAVLGRIFEPFFSTKPGGTGVGLAIAQEVVRRHRGSMSIESAKGTGTAVHVRLPLFPPD